MGIDDVVCSSCESVRAYATTSSNHDVFIRDTDYMTQKSSPHIAYTEVNEPQIIMDNPPSPIQAAPPVHPHPPPPAHDPAAQTPRTNSVYPR